MKPAKKKVSRTSKTRVYVSRRGKAQESERAESSRRILAKKGSFSRRVYHQLKACSVPLAPAAIAGTLDEADFYSGRHRTLNQFLWRKRKIRQHECQHVHVNVFFPSTL